MALYRSQELESDIGNDRSYIFKGISSLLQTNIRKSNKCLMICLTYDETLQSSSAFGGIQYSIAVPFQLVAINPIGRPPNPSWIIRP